MKRFSVLATALLALLLLLPAATPGMTGRAVVIKYRAAKFGPILATPKKQALYYWTVEKRVGGKIRCTGACAKAWPPLVVRRRADVTRSVSGIRGTFGVVRRSDGRLQVTYNGLAVYTYANERPTQVLCDDVNGWFVVRLK
jgi:predicted lipoprotein with Yx(FWY)xxD motif